MVTDKDIRMWLDNLDSHLLVVLGASKVPLAYVTRDEVALPQGADLPGGYASVQAEMIRRAPHESAEYQLDNTTVWDILRKSVHGTQAGIHIAEGIGLRWCWRSRARRGLTRISKKGQ
jgi:hypothetical protein